jgi:hypothetical protein
MRDTTVLTRDDPPDRHDGEATPARRQMDEPISSADARPRRSFLRRLKLILLGSAISLLAINVWTGGPLLALWIAGHVQKGTLPTLTYVVVVVVSLAIISFIFVKLLARLSAAYEGASERPQRRVRGHVPWLRSMRGERPTYEGEGAPTVLLDRVLTLSVTGCVLAFETWFFFFAHMTLPGGGSR